MGQNSYIFAFKHTHSKTLLMTLLYKIENMYTLMKNKAHIHNKQPRIYITRIPRSQHRKTNVTSALPRVESELHRTEVSAVVRYQTSKKESPPTIRCFGGHDHQTAAVVTTAQYRYCRRSSYADIQDETGTTPLEDHHTVPPALSRSTPLPESGNAFYTRQDAAPIGNTTFPRTDVFTTFIRPSHKKKTCGL